MKKVLVATLFSVMFSVSANASNIGIIDVEKIIKESKAMRDIQAKIAKQQEVYQKEVSKKQEGLEAEQKKIEGKKNVLEKDAFEKEVTAFEKKVDDLKTFVDRKQNSLKKASLDGMSKVNDEVKDIISDVAKEKSLDVIIPASQVLFFKDELDVTEEVLENLNKKITKVKVSFE